MSETISDQLAAALGSGPQDQAVRDLIAVLTDLISGQIDSKEAQVRLRQQPTGPVVSLQGAEIGGNATFGDVAGGNIIKLTIDKVIYQVPADGPPITLTSPAVGIRPLPSIPTIEPPPAARLSDDELRLTPQGRQRFRGALQNVDWMNDAKLRGQLLQNLPRRLVNNMQLDGALNGYIVEVLRWCESSGRLVGGDFDGKYPLIIVAETAAAISGFGEEGAPAEAAMFMALANALREKVGQAAVPLPFSD